MLFEEGYIYRVYNQGNNRQPVFYTRANYFFFLEKVKAHILPFADILAWCLMPNHFHLMIYVKSVKTCRMLNIDEFEKPDEKYSLNESFGIMLRSYVRAINVQERRSGSLFRKETKAICVNCNEKVARAWFVSQGITQINNPVPEREYPNVCYNYIMFNPLKDGIVKRNEEWEFSSYPDILGLRHGKLINRETIKKLGLEVSEEFLDL